MSWPTTPVEDGRLRLLLMVVIKVSYLGVLRMYEVGRDFLFMCMGAMPSSIVKGEEKKKILSLVHVTCHIQGVDYLSYALRRDDRNTSEKQ